jgi:hypothetical protein
LAAPKQRDCFEKLGNCRIPMSDYRSVLFMKNLAMIAFFALMLVHILAGCASSGPSPEQRTREAEQELQAQRQQAEFRKGLPPVANPGQGQ